MNYDLTINQGSDYIKVFTIKENGIPKDLTSYSATFYVVNSPGASSTVEFSTINGKLLNGLTAGTLTLSLTPADIETIDGEFYRLEIDSGTVQTEILSGNLFLLSDTKSGVEYLIPALRLHLGDTNPLSYRYMDEWLEVSLITAIKALMRWWGMRYLVGEDNSVTRNPSLFFELDAPPIIQQSDERPIILMASILVKSGQLESNSWSVGSWKDAEIAVSNIEGSRGKQFGINLDWQELLYYLKPMSKQLFAGTRIEVPDETQWVN